MVTVSTPAVHEIASVPFVFGLDWFAVIGPDAKHEAHRIARSYKANHISVASKHAASVGMANINLKNYGGKKIYCAAQVLAGHWPNGTVAILMQINKGIWWLLALHDGAVIARTDFLCGNREDALTVINELYETYPSLTVLDALNEDLSLAKYLSKNYELALLLPVKKGLFGLLLTRWQLVAVLILFIFILFYFSVIRATNPKYIQHQVSENSVQLAWDKALQQVTDKHWVHGVEGTIRVLQNLYGIPVVVAGWNLIDAECIPRQSMWSCQANYSRRHVHASNLNFIENAPNNWQIQFTPLDQALAKWSDASLGISLTDASINETETNEKLLFSNLQSIRPALVNIFLSKTKPLPVVAPLDEEGRTIPIPAGLPILKQRDLEVKLPLRSASVFLPNVEHVGWRRVFLSILPNAKPSLLESQVNLTLQGVLYEKS